MVKIDNMQGQDKAFERRKVDCSSVGLLLFVIFRLLHVLIEWSSIAVNTSSKLSAPPTALIYDAALCTILVLAAAQAPAALARFFRTPHILRLFVCFYLSVWALKTVSSARKSYTVPAMQPLPVLQQFALWCEISVVSADPFCAEPLQTLQDD